MNNYPYEPYFGSYIPNERHQSDNFKITPHQTHNQRFQKPDNSYKNKEDALIIQLSERLKQKEADFKKLERTLQNEKVKCNELISLSPVNSLRKFDRYSINTQKVRQSQRYDDYSGHNTPSRLLLGLKIALNILKNITVR